MSSLAVIRDAIARAVLRDPDDEEVQIGRITLRPLQRDGLRRVRAAMEEFGGALLADEAGLGKTFVALALARSYRQALVVAPAALRNMWHHAAASTQTAIAFVSFETLSRRDISSHADLVVVDEAHHACHPAAARYGRIARLAAKARVLLLSATPVRNRASELDALLALFLGARASRLDAGSRSRCIIRRSGAGAVLPAIDGPYWHEVPQAPSFAGRIRALPPPLPAHDGRAAQALVIMTLARCWASSLAALDAAFRRRLHRGAALHTLLDDGRLPTQAELDAWVIGDDAMQLALPFLVSHQETDTTKMRAVLCKHVHAVRALRGSVTPLIHADTVARAEILLELRRHYPLRRMIAFSAHAVTAEAIFRALRRVPGVALLTGRGARTASGARPRADVLAALRASAPAPTAGAVDDIALVITTDVLSEGVNLQGASVVVHLDLPWTPAGLEQRVGRAARIGSTHAVVCVHGIAPPAAAERMLALHSRLAKKQAAGTAASGASVDMERLRSSLVSWRRGASHEEKPAGVASVRAARPGFLAVVLVGPDRKLIAGTGRGDGRFVVSDAPGQLLAVVQRAGGHELETRLDVEDRARAAIRRWLNRRLVLTAAGDGSAVSSGRRLLLQRADRALATAPAYSRARLASRIAALRERIDACVSAGAEMLLRELARHESGNANSWLDDCERQLPPPKAAGTRPPADAALQVGALLLLSPGPAAPPPVPGPRARPAAST